MRRIDYDNAHWCPVPPKPRRGCGRLEQPPGPLLKCRAQISRGRRLAITPSRFGEKAGRRQAQEWLGVNWVRHRGIVLLRMFRCLNDPCPSHAGERIVTASSGASRNSAPCSGRLVRICEGPSGGQAEGYEHGHHRPEAAAVRQRRSRGSAARGDRAPPHVPPVAGRGRQNQSLDTGKSAVGPPPVHAGKRRAPGGDVLASPCAPSPQPTGQSSTARPPRPTTTATMRAAPSAGLRAPI